MAKSNGEHWWTAEIHRALTGSCSSRRLDAEPISNARYATAAARPATRSRCGPGSASFGGIPASGDLLTALLAATPGPNGRERAVAEELSRLSPRRFEQIGSANNPRTAIMQRSAAPANGGIGHGDGHLRRPHRRGRTRRLRAAVSRRAHRARTTRTTTTPDASTTAGSTDDPALVARPVDTGDVRAASRAGRRAPTC